VKNHIFTKVKNMLYAYQYFIILFRNRYSKSLTKAC